MLPDTTQPVKSAVADADWPYTVGTPNPRSHTSLPASPTAKPLLFDGPDEDVQGCFHALLRNLPWPSRDSARRITTLAMTSCYRQEGVTTMATQTALAAASSGAHRVLLVDANLTCPVAHRRFQQSLVPGLAEVILDHHSLPSAIRDNQQHLAILPAGYGEPSRVYEPADRWIAILANLKQNFDLVIFDMPATSEVKLAMPLFGLFDGVLLVVEHERVRWQAALKQRQALIRANANVLGVAFNKRTEHIPAWLYRSL